jgi:hypothetical protein
MPIFCSIDNDFTGGLLIHIFLDSPHKGLYRLKAFDAPGLEDLDGVGLQLVIPSKTFVETNHALR